MKKFLIAIVCLAFITPAFAENLTLTTYYPAPSGAYKALRSHGICVGSNCTHALITDNTLSVEGRIGVGTTAPGYALQVGTGVSTHNMPNTGVLINNDLEVHGTIWGDGSQLTNVIPTPAGADKEVQFNNNTVTAGAANFVFDQGTGNVGIGSANPQARLTVQGSGATTATSGLTVRNSFNATNLTVLDNGAVGIGTTTPAAVLHVMATGNAGPVASDNTIILQASTAFIPSGMLGVNPIKNSPGISFLEVTNTVRGGLGLAGFDGAWSRDSKPGDIVLRTTFGGDIHLATHPVVGSPLILTKLLVKNNGNVGVGTNAPSTTLDINGQIRVRGGTPGANKVLTSDANGLATWQVNGAATIPAGTLCGMADVNGSQTNINCLGVNPGFSCPATYTRAKAAQIEGNSVYTCVKN